MNKRSLEGLIVMMILLGSLMSASSFVFGQALGTRERPNLHAPCPIDRSDWF